MCTDVSGITMRTSGTQHAGNYVCPLTTNWTSPSLFLLDPLPTLGFLFFPLPFSHFPSAAARNFTRKFPFSRLAVNCSSLQLLLLRAMTTLHFEFWLKKLKVGWGVYTPDLTFKNTTVPVQSQAGCCCLPFRVLAVSLIFKMTASLFPL